MAKSRNRGGAKAHRKRVQKRNEKLGIQKTKMQKMFTEMYKSRLEGIRDALSGITEGQNESNKYELELPSLTNVQSEKENSESEVSDSEDTLKESN